jgi:sec-independent protein translocase protein TatA
MPLGTGELVIILLIVVVVFGSTKLPQLGDGLGRAIKNFKRAVSPPEEIEGSNKDADTKDAAVVNEQDPKAKG